MVEPWFEKYPLNRKEDNFEAKNFWQWRERTRFSGQLLFPNHAPCSGYFTDYQIFGRALSTEEMYDITSCKSFPQGDIYSWMTGKPGTRSYKRVRLEQSNTEKST